MNKIGLMVASVVFSTVMGGSSFAEGDFDAACKAGTDANHPEISDSTAACACLKSNGTQSVIDEVLVATSPADFSDVTKDVMKSCGYSFE